MKNIMKSILASGLLISSLTVTAAENTQCPTDMVKFWKTYAKSTQINDAIPRFLLINDCFRANTSMDFYFTTLQRLDKPEADELVDALYAQLTWTDGYQY